MQAFNALDGAIQATRDKVGGDIEGIQKALGTAPSAAENLAAIETQISNLFVDDNSSIEQSLALREQQRQAVLDVLNEELSSIDTQRKAAEDAHQAELRLYQERQREIDRALSSVSSARANVGGDISTLQRRIAVGGRELTTDENISFVQEALDANTGDSLSSLQERLGLQEQLAQLEIQRLDEVMQRQGQAAEQQKQALDRLREAGESLLDTLDALKIDRSTSLLTNKQIFDESKSQFDELFKKAQAGDADAANELGNAARTLLKENQAFNASGDAAVALQDDVFGKLESLGVDLANTPEKAVSEGAYFSGSLQAQQDTVGKLETIDSAMADTAAALEALREEQPPAPTELDKLDELIQSANENALAQLEGIDFSL